MACLHSPSWSSGKLPRCGLCPHGITKSVSQSASQWSQKKRKESLRRRLGIDLATSRTVTTHDACMSFSSHYLGKGMQGDGLWGVDIEPSLDEIDTVYGVLTKYPKGVTLGW